MTLFLVQQKLIKLVFCVFPVLWMDLEAQQLKGKEHQIQQNHWVVVVEEVMYSEVAIPWAAAEWLIYLGARLLSIWSFSEGFCVFDTLNAHWYNENWHNLKKKRMVFVAFCKSILFPQPWVPYLQKVYCLTSLGLPMHPNESTLLLLLPLSTSLTFTFDTQEIQSSLVGTHHIADCCGSASTSIESKDLDLQGIIISFPRSKFLVSLYAVQQCICIHMYFQLFYFCTAQQYHNDFRHFF